MALQYLFFALNEGKIVITYKQCADRDAFYSISAYWSTAQLATAQWRPLHSRRSPRTHLLTVDVALLVRAAALRV